MLHQESKERKKKRRKEVKNAPPLQKDPAPTSFEKILARYPKVKAKKVVVATKGKGKKISKRTTPTLVASRSDVFHQAPEGKRWNRTLEKQTLSQNLHYRKKTAKQPLAGKNARMLKGSR